MFLFFSSKKQASDAGIEIQNLKDRIVVLEKDLARSQDENYNLANTLYAEQERNTNFENQINEIAGTVGVLEKLSKTDPELLQKYSKVFFLNEHYTPPRTEQIDPEYTRNGVRDLYLHADVIPHLENLLEKAKGDGMSLKIASAFRSFDTQEVLKTGYTITYGAGTANQFSADQGYSEHQLGTTVDFTTPALGNGLVGFHNTPEFKWLKENAYRYGFILSYPENNTYYQYEPWHWRFVGRDLARYLNREEINFYDLDQRTIDEYLVNIFD